MEYKYCFIFICVTILFSCSSPQTKLPADKKIMVLKGSTNNNLEVLDWGGSGKPLVFLTGLGSSAHVYNDFAPQFADKFHVYVLTRRGFGASEQTVDGYNTTTLTKDVLAVVDSLHLAKVILIGHSIAGDELTKFASSYPDRVEKIIYLDAAYDHSNFADLWVRLPEYPKATKEDSASLSNLNGFLEKFFGIRFPEDELKQIVVLSNDGKYVKDVTPDSINAVMIKGSEHPNYLGVKCPALAIYAGVDSITQIVKWYPTLDSANKKKADVYLNYFITLLNTEENRFKKEVAGGTIKVIKGANHYLFISHPAETEKMIRDFIQ